MQRTNRILNSRKHNGFAMIMAIILIVVLSTIMAIMLNLTQKTTKETTNLYLKEEAVFLAKSATELALLEISGHDRNTTTTYLTGKISCLHQVNAVYPNATHKIFDINTTIRYIGFNCQNLNAIYVKNINTPESNGSVLIDTTVTSAPNTSTQTIRYFRRTIQKL